MNRDLQNEHGMSDGGATGAGVNGDALDGFWLPRELREEVLSRATWETVGLRGGMLTETGTAGGCGAAAGAGGGVRVRWPRLSASQWAALLDRLQAARRIAGSEAARRWEAALAQVVTRLADEVPAMLPVLSAATGYTPAMLASALAGGDLVDPSSLAAALDDPPTWAAASGWVTQHRLGGRIRFYPHGLAGRARGAVPRDGALFRPAPATDLTLGFAAGNVPGTALIMALLGSLANHAAPGARSPPPCSCAPAATSRSSPRGCSPPWRRWIPTWWPALR